jgi:hypothetical protein
MLGASIGNYQVLAPASTGLTWMKISALKDCIDTPGSLSTVRFIV